MEKTIYTRYSEALIRRIVSMRKAAGLNQRQLAKALKREHSFISRIEVGERRVDLPEFHQIAKACKADPEKEVVALIREFKSMDSSS